MSGWWKSLPNGLPNVVSLPKSGHRRAGKGREFPWRCNVDTIAMDLKVSWEMSVKDLLGTAQEVGRFNFVPAAHEVRTKPDGTEPRREGASVVWLSTLCN